MVALSTADQSGLDERFGGTTLHTGLHLDSSPSLTDATRPVIYAHENLLGSTPLLQIPECSVVQCSAGQAQTAHAHMRDGFLHGALTSTSRGELCLHPVSSSRPEQRQHIT